MTKLIEELREYAEWAEANIWEVPITLPDVLRAAADKLAESDNGAQRSEDAPGRVVSVESNLYDQETIHYPCTVQILRNSVTGETSTGWWKGPPEKFGREAPDEE